MNTEETPTPKKKKRAARKKMASRRSIKPEASGASPSFEESLESLESAVRRLESGELSLSDSLKCYEEGIRWLRHCYEKLENAEQRVAMLTEVNDQGEFTAVRFDEAEMSLDEKASSRGARRSAPGTQEPGTQDASASTAPHASDGVDGFRGLF